MCSLLACLACSSTLYMGAICFPKTSINFYQTKQCHVPENSTLPSHCHETLKPDTWRMTRSIEMKACHSVWCLYNSRVCQVIQIVDEQKHLSRCVTTDLEANAPWCLGKLKVCNKTSASKLRYFWLPYQQVFQCLSWLHRRTVYNRSQMSEQSFVLMYHFYSMSW